MLEAFFKLLVYIPRHVAAQRKPVLKCFLSFLYKVIIQKTTQFTIKFCFVKPTTTKITCCFNLLNEVKPSMTKA